jgi:hypothetical protein
MEHVALTNHLPNKSKIVPDEISFNDFFRNLVKQTIRNGYKIIMVHNHPTGAVNPSEEDKKVTESLQKIFSEHFAGHLILDHGSFGLYMPYKEWEVIERKTIEDDPLIKNNRKVLFDYDFSKGFVSEKMQILRCALQIDDTDQWNSRDWVAVAFTSAEGDIRALHYYHTSEFTNQNATEYIVQKTTDIAKRSGAIWAFPYTDNEDMLNPITDITKETEIF